MLALLPLLPYKSAKSTMNTYWELYVAYINKCVCDNWKNDVDPHHYEMEWNHFLPRCIFGDWPIGQWLTKRQHAIATALQTLAFNKCCLFGSHLNYLPKDLLSLVLPIYCSRSVENGKKIGARRGPILGRENVELSRGFLDPKNREKVEEGRRKGGSKVGSVAGPKNVINQKGPWDPKNKEMLSIWGKAGMEALNKQEWMSTIDGYVSTAAGVANHNKSLGADTSARVRIN